MFAEPFPGIVLSESRKVGNKDDLGGRVPLTKNHHAMQQSNSLFTVAGAAPSSNRLAT